MDVRIVETLVMLEIGDGVLTALFPVERCTRWEAGLFVPVIAWFRERPGLTRALGVAKVVGAVAFAASLSKSPEPAWKT